VPWKGNFALSVTQTATAFCADLAPRFAGDVQVTSDGYTSYRIAVASTFDRERTDFAQLIKIYGKDKQGFDAVLRTERRAVFGQPDMTRVNTSFVERSNLTLRMGNRRFTRKTNAFSKKLENHLHMLALTYMYYNFCRTHVSLKTTPALAAGVADRRWTLEMVIEMTDAYFTKQLNAQFEAAFAAREASGGLYKLQN
jgi:IS1 family transposase